VANDWRELTGYSDIYPGRESIWGGQLSSAPADCYSTIIVSLLRTADRMLYRSLGLQYSWVEELALRRRQLNIHDDHPNLIRTPKRLHAAAR
jgi:hypothetical protein